MYGSIEQWYSFRTPNYDELLQKNPYEQVIGQVMKIELDLDQQLEKVPPPETFNQL